MSSGTMNTNDSFKGLIIKTPRDTFNRVLRYNNRKHWVPNRANMIKRHIGLLEDDIRRLKENTRKKFAFEADSQISEIVDKAGKLRHIKLRSD